MSDLDECELMSFTGHTLPVWAVAVTPDGSKIVTGSSDGTSKVFDINRDHCLLTLTGHTANAVAVTPDGTKVVTGSYDETAKIFDLTLNV